MGGSASGNSTSTTAPTTCTTLPIFIGSLRLAAGDLEQFPGDVALPQLVVFELQRANEVFGAVGRALHRHHARALLARFGVQQRDVDEDVEIALQQVAAH